MTWANLAVLRGWLQTLGPMVPLVLGGVSVAILLGCAVASWIAPSRKSDCMFHRQVM
jgi:hypothetical protein